MWNLNNPLRVIRVGCLSVTVQRQSSLQHQLQDWSLLPAACLLTPGPATVWESIKTVFLWWYLGGTWWTVACWWQLYEQLQSVSRLVCGVWPGSESQPPEFVWYEWESNQEIDTLLSVEVGKIRTFAFFVPLCSPMCFKHPGTIGILQISSVPFPKIIWQIRVTVTCFMQNISLLQYA